MVSIKILNLVDRDEWFCKRQRRINQKHSPGNYYNFTRRWIREANISGGKTSQAKVEESKDIYGGVSTEISVNQSPPRSSSTNRANPILPTE